MELTKEEKIRKVLFDEIIDMILEKANQLDEDEEEDGLDEEIDSKGDIFINNIINELEKINIHYYKKMNTEQNKKEKSNISINIIKDMMEVIYKNLEEE